MSGVIEEMASSEADDGFKLPESWKNRMEALVAGAIDYDAVEMLVTECAEGAGDGWPKAAREILAAWDFKGPPDTQTRADLLACGKIADTRQHPVWAFGFADAAEAGHFTEGCLDIPACPDEQGYSLVRADFITNPEGAGADVAVLIAPGVQRAKAAILLRKLAAWLESDHEAFPELGDEGDRNEQLVRRLDPSSRSVLPSPAVRAAVWERRSGEPSVDSILSSSCLRKRTRTHTNAEGQTDAS